MHLPACSLDRLLDALEEQWPAEWAVVGYECQEGGDQVFDFLTGPALVRSLPLE